MAVARKVRKPTDTVHLKLRLSEVLRRRLVREAEPHKLSLNTVIIFLLEEALANRERDRKRDPNAAAARALLDSLNPAVVQKMVEIFQSDRDFFAAVLERARVREATRQAEAEEKEGGSK
jgi:hypothetical protein